uniref:Solute carrier family 25 member 48 n=1 Tax=Cyanoderma ruficeps TaxID=181631 RepID=A0A8C3RK54_9PASS
TEQEDTALSCTKGNIGWILGKVFFTERVRKGEKGLEWPLAGFFKGMSFPLASVGIYSSVVFGVFSNTQRFLSRLRHGDPAAAPSLADMTLASIVAGVISVGIGTPVELVKIRLQMQTQPYNKAAPPLAILGSPVYRGPIHCLRTILQKEGIAGVYRGNVAMLLRDVPGYCAYFIPYAMFCDWITPDGSISPNPFSIWVAGGVAGAVSWAVCTPMDVVKSRLQADGVYLNQYKGILDCMWQSYQNEGLKVSQMFPIDFGVNELVPVGLSWHSGCVWSPWAMLWWS